MKDSKIMIITGIIIVIFGGIVLMNTIQVENAKIQTSLPDENGKITYDYQEELNKGLEEMREGLDTSIDSSKNKNPLITPIAIIDFGIITIIAGFYSAASEKKKSTGAN